MANEMFTQLPQVTNALSSDIICAVQGNVSVQETLAQVNALSLSYTILNYPGSPVGVLAGNKYQLCWDTADSELFICTTSGVAGVAVWEEITAGISSVIPASQGGTGVASPTAHTLPVAEGSSDFNFLGPLTNGQLLIGSTGADPVAATITAGAGMTVSNGAGTITLSSTGTGSLAWSVVTGATPGVSNNGYICNSGSTVVITLPVSSSVGDEIAVMGQGSGGWKVAQNSGQNIILGSSASTAGVSGFIASTNLYDSIVLICTVADTTWTALGGPQGIITVS